nr:uncharacterized protein LOC128694501 [Cherax quadricarinatus]
MPNNKVIPVRAVSSSSSSLEIPTMMEAYSSVSVGCGVRVSVLTITGGVITLLSVAAVVIPLTRCGCCYFLDLWLIFLGVSALGAMLGILIWRTKLSRGKLLNGPMIFAALLISINLLCLSVGNVIVGLELATCTEHNDKIMVDSCNYPYIYFSLCVVVTFDFVYSVLFLVLWLSSCSDRVRKMRLHLNNDYFTFPYCCFPHHSYQLSWQEWVGVVIIAANLLLAIASIVMGVVFYTECYDYEWTPDRLIVQGVVTVAAVGVGLWYLKFPSWTTMTWPPASFFIFSPLLALIMFHVGWTAIGQ